MEIFNIVLYCALFVILYVQVFLLLAFFENLPELGKKGQKAARSRFNQNGSAWRSNLPSATIIVPCYNEAPTLSTTVRSLLALDYPSEKLTIFIVDDGSTDETLKLARSFKDHEQVSVFSKPNGGKHTALNYGLARADSDLVGCLDADSTVESDALLEVAEVFEEESVSAVIPAIRTNRPGSFFQLMQKAEYNTSVFLRKTFALLGAVQITPGPFSIFRRKALEQVGYYRRAHNTEDMEMALRLNFYGHTIENAHRALAYTNCPAGFRALFRQRVRWTYGYLNNAIDYRKMLLNPKYGHLGLVVLPAGLFTMLALFFFLFFIASVTIGASIEKATEVQTVGWSALSPVGFDWFVINTGWSTFLFLSVLISTLIMVFVGKRMAERTWRPSLDMAVFLVFYGYLAATWIIKSFFNTVFARGKESWD